MGVVRPRPTRSYLQWGNDSIAHTTTTRYLTPGYGDVIAPTVVAEQVVPTNGVLRNFRVKQNAPAGNGNSSVYAVRVNGALTAISATVASTTTAGVEGPPAGSPQAS